MTGTCMHITYSKPAAEGRISRRCLAFRPGSPYSHLWVGTGCLLGNGRAGWVCVHACGLHASLKP